MRLIGDKTEKLWLFYGELLNMTEYVMICVLLTYMIWYIQLTHDK